MALLEVKNITKRFGKTEVLKGIDFSLEKGQVLSIIGSSGSGKTTLLRCLNFLETPDEGTISINGNVIFDAATGLFSVTGLMAKSLVIDGVIENINLCKYFTIICENPQPICDFITGELHRGATIYKAEGAYTHSEKTVILTIMKRSQAVQLRNFVRQHEPTAFITITNSSEIIGKGFRGFN